MTQKTECEFVFKCDKQWNGLEETSNPKIRECESCGKEVHLCMTEKEVLKCAKNKQCVCYAPIDTRHFHNPLSMEYSFKDDKPFKIIPNEPLMEGMERLRCEGVDLEAALDNAEPMVTLGLPYIDADPADSLPKRLNELIKFKKDIEVVEKSLKEDRETVLFLVGGIVLAYGLIQLVTGTLVNLLLILIAIATSFTLYKAVIIFRKTLKFRALNRNLIETAKRASNAFSRIKSMNVDVYPLKDLEVVDYVDDDITKLRNFFRRL